MLTLTLYLTSLHFLLPSLVAGAPAYTPTDYILLNCGSSSNETSPDGRKWEADNGSKFSPTDLQSTSSSSSSSSTASRQDPSVTQVPYMTARIFQSQFTYTFPVSSGPKFVRLYFYPATYSGRDISKSFFSVMANSYTLLSNFSAFLTVSAIKPPVASLIKEFCINVLDKQRLNITFSPSPRSYAFINGIEIVSMPSNLYIGNADHLIKLLSFNYYYTLDNTTALETLYRLNIGGGDVSVNKDTGMFRTWNQDFDYIYGAALGTTPYRSNITIRYTLETPAYSAPEIVYRTTRTMGGNSMINTQYNLTWVFTVDGGFRYLFRLHFCEIQLEVTRLNERVFNVYIANQTAQKEADIIGWTGGPGTPVYKDYVVVVQDPDGRRSKQNLWLALHPDMGTNAKFADAILNGIEIFRINQSDGSLAVPNPDPMVSPTPPGANPQLLENTKSKGFSTVKAITGVLLGFVGVVAVLCLLCFLIFRRRRRVKNDGTSQTKSSCVPFSYGSRSSSLPPDLCRHFSIAELKSATSNFRDNFVIGAGGFGSVYKGHIHIDGTSTTVAIKRLNPLSNQGVREFRTEIETLSQLRHLHLVSLIGYCDEDGEMILVYDYMSHGTLRDHLYSTKNPPLPWKQRLEICIGAARGLHYLHTGAKHTIIHRDVKSTNILLDEKWTAKVSDFGLCKMSPINMPNSHISTIVKGSFGYIDPEYYRRQQLTEKSDLYSFGVVLFEVLCARPALISDLPKEQVSLAEWARNCYQSGTLDQIIDPNLKPEIAPECLKKFGEIANSCVRDHGIDRPTMNDVVWMLGFALQLQEDAEKINNGDGFGVSHIGTNHLQCGNGNIISKFEKTLLGFVVFPPCMKKRESSKIFKKSSLPHELCRHFTLSEIQTATNNFSKAQIIGDGGFGRVYEGYIDGGRAKVAVKRLKRKSLQGACEFWTEIEMLSRLRHLHLVSLIGYCNERGQMILVYDYMARGTLREHLYKTENPRLPWKKRLEICIGAARGLDYLHAGAEHIIIHRDVKTTNILLDENWVAKVSDFGLSKAGRTYGSQCHISTEVKGTFGYLDPEYYRSRWLTVKSDVYAFGVVLFEVLCGRPAVDMEVEEEQHGLALWARQCAKDGTVDHIVDRHLREEIAPECLKVFSTIAEKCLCEGSSERPKMGEVVWSLEFALELQESADASKDGIKIGGAHKEEIDGKILLCGSENPVESSTNSSDSSTIEAYVSAVEVSSGKEVF